jgi:hypothetical protein
MQTELDVQEAEITEPALDQDVPTTDEDDEDEDDDDETPDVD